MVMVWTGGQVRQQMLTLAEPVSQEQLSNAAGHINLVCEGLDADGIAAIDMVNLMRSNWMCSS